jgi:cytochrome o ubiquinol oxidase subunit 2
MIAMALIMWTSTHKLDPRTPIDSNTKPLVVQVVALRWKWLFIYPEQHIATVNFVELPAGTPVQFDLTADNTPMSSFWIPHLSGQLYAMTGHINTLNIQASTPGTYQGSSAEINGSGFAGMKFVANVDKAETFSQWVEATQQSASALNAVDYAKLLAPSENNPPQYYSNPPADLYASIVMKYMGAHEHMAGMEE